jgi:hypothetical protein
MNKMRSGLKHLLCYSLATPKYDSAIPKTVLLGLPASELIQIYASPTCVGVRYYDCNIKITREHVYYNRFDCYDSVYTIYCEDLITMMSDRIIDGVHVRRDIQTSIPGA